MGPIHGSVLGVHENGVHDFTSTSYNLIRDCQYSYYYC